MKDLKPEIVKVRGCKYCTDSVQKTGNKYMCKHDICPYADEFMGYYDYEDYFTNNRVEFTGIFNSKVDRLYH